MNRFLLRSVPLILALGLLSLPASASTITFSGATFGQNFTGPVTEAGFTYSTLSGSLYVDNHGNPGNDMEGCSVCAPSPPGGVLQIVSATPGGTFTFNQLDFAAYDQSAFASVSITLEGYLGATLVGADVYTLPGTSTCTGSPCSYSNWTTEVANVLAGDALSSLDIVLPASLNTGTPPPGPETYAAIDNVVLTPTMVTTPEPGSLMLLGASLIGLAGLSRRKVAR